MSFCMFLLSCLHSLPHVWFIDFVHIYIYSCPSVCLCCPAYIGYLLPHVWFNNFVHMHIYLFIFFFSFLLFICSFFCFISIILFTFYIVIICYLDLSHNFYCHGNSIFTWISLLAFVNLDLSSWTCVLRFV